MGAQDATQAAEQEHNRAQQALKYARVVRLFLGGQGGQEGQGNLVGVKRGVEQGLTGLSPEFNRWGFDRSCPKRERWASALHLSEALLCVPRID